MLTARTPSDLRRHVDAWRSTGERIGFVPTMGALHEGHLSLVHLAREHADRVVASVFVNPTQFGPREDFTRYPRQPEKDAAMLAEAGCDLLFLPDTTTIYPSGHATFVEPGGAAEGLEGEIRPGHFRGVATVVCALFNLVRADVAVFGEKDAQQPVAAGDRCADAVRRRMRDALNAEPLARVEYAEVVDGETFQPVEVLKGRLVLPLAVRVGGTRLIDNLRLTVEENP